MNTVDFIDPAFAIPTGIILWSIYLLRMRKLNRDAMRAQKNNQSI